MKKLLTASTLALMTGFGVGRYTERPLPAPSIAQLDMKEVSARPGEYIGVQFECEEECERVQEWRLYQQANNEHTPETLIDTARGSERVLQMQVPEQGARWFLKVRGVVDGEVGPASEEILVTREKP